MDPLRTANDVGLLLRAMRKYPVGLPDRAGLIAAAIDKQRYHAGEIAALLERLDSIGLPLVQTSDLVAESEREIHLLPPVDACVACGEPGLLVDRGPDGKARPPSTPTVVTERGILNGILHRKSCAKCGALHCMSYASGGTHIPVEQQMPYPGATNRTCCWVQLSSRRAKCGRIRCFTATRRRRSSLTRATRPGQMSTSVEDRRRHP